MERIARTALRAHEDRFHGGVYEWLSSATRERLDALLRPDRADGADPAQDNTAGSAPAVLLKLRGSPGRPSLASLQDELAKLELIRQIALPADLFERASPRDLERCRRRVSVEVPRDLRRHPDAARLTWLAAFVHLRARSLTDDLVDLLIETIHQIGARAERKVERELRRFTKKNVQHPTYKAFAELGKAIKTIFLCHYLHSEELRREINEGLNVVKQWNGANPYGRFDLDMNARLALL